MSDRPLVTFDRVWKKFELGERHDSLRDLIPALARRLGTRPAPSDLSQREFWALRDVSFEVRRGEALGIIGQNGAGKSTVLKTLTKLLRPTRGSCHIVGRAGALIEVAAGFHPELTGIENVYLQGAIMGMKRAEIAERLDAIIDFAAVGSFVNTPVKRYSSGMNARLGFSIAAHLNPDVLIIDEVLAVGDIAFQEKCERRMLEFKRSGVAIVFVSHNLAAVSRLCDRTLLLEQGQAAELGPSQEVIARYVNATQVRHETDAGCTIHVAATDGTAVEDRLYRPGQRVRLDVNLAFHVATRGATLRFTVWSFRSGEYVYEARSHQAGLDLFVADPGDQRAVSLEFDAHLTRGLYRVDLDVVEPSTQNFLGSLSGAFVFTISEHRSQNGVANLYLAAGAAAADAPAAHAPAPAFQPGAGLSAPAASDEPPLVSVIIPVYNGERFINEAIESALNQTYRPIEVIVVDDGSHEPIEPRLSAWADRIRVCRTPNRGVAAARNFGIRQSKGEYIALLDQDDVWRPEKLQRQIDVLTSRADVGLVHSDVVYRDERQGRTYRQTRPRAALSGQCYATLFAGSSIAACTIVMRRSAIEAVGPFDERIQGTDDYDMALRISRRFALAYVDEPLAVYRVHETNWSHRSVDMLRGELKVVEKAIADDPELDDRVGANIVRTRHADLLRAIGCQLVDAQDPVEGRRLLARSLRVDFRPRAVVWYASAFAPRPLLSVVRWLKRPLLRQARLEN